MRTYLLAPLIACSVAAPTFAAPHRSIEAERAALNRQQAEIAQEQLEASRIAHDRDIRAYDRETRSYNSAVRAHQARVMRYQRDLARYEAKREAYELRKTAYEAHLAGLQQDRHMNPTAAPVAQPVGIVPAIETLPAIQPAAVGNAAAVPAGSPPGM